MQVQVKCRALLLLIEFIYIDISCEFGFVGFFVVGGLVLVQFFVGFCFVFVSAFKSFPI